MRARALTSAPALLPLLLGALACASPRPVTPDTLDRLLEQTVTTRYLPAPEERDVRIVSREALAEVLRESMAEALEGYDVPAYQKSLVALGLWPSERDVLDDVLSLTGQAAAGVYVPHQRRLYVLDDLELPWTMRLLQRALGWNLSQEMVVAHEFVHLLQHAGYPELFDESPYFQTQDDLALAQRAAVEGDATRYGLEAMGLGKAFTSFPLPDPKRFKKAMIREKSKLVRRSKAVRETPALLRESFIFPYSHGYGLSYESGLALLDEPPISTEQVLHGDRRNAPFLAIDLSALGADLPEGCVRLSENTVGELYLSILVLDHLGESKLSISDGWDGDRYLTAECTEGLEFLWLTYWDSEADAVEFEEAYATMATSIQAQAMYDEPPIAIRNGKRVAVSTPAWRQLAADAERRGRQNRVHDVDGMRRHFGIPAAPEATADQERSSFANGLAAPSSPATAEARDTADSNSD